MKTQIKQIACSSALMAMALLTSCVKSKETVNVSQPLLLVGQPVSNVAPIHGSVKGTMLTDQVYYIDGDVTVNHGDTLVMQPGVKVYFTGNYNIVVKGSFLSLGSKDKPNYITYKDLVKTDVVGQDPTTDPAYKGSWGGILGDTNTDHLIIKWTHVEFGGGKLGTSPVSYLGNGKTAYMIGFANPKGIFVLEDSWIYGGVDDPIRVLGGKIHVMRNTFEKGGITGGESCNIKSGTVGNFAYNLTVGSATNGPKPSNNGGKNPTTNIYIYNNTIVNSGYRRSASGRGGSINFEEASQGVAYNNIIANCRYGLRIVASSGNYNGNALVGADTAHIRYGYNLNYNDSLTYANQIYPVLFGTQPKATDIPAPSSFLPANYTLGAVYDGAKAVRAAGSNPMFVNFALPASGKFSDISFATGYNFRLMSGSPAIGKGFTGFAPLSVVPVDANFGATEITPPSADLGAFSSNGSGNQH